MLNGPRLEAASGTADSVVVLLHGYGADGEDLIALAREWQPVLPRAAFIAPHAPEVLPMAGPAGRQWFPLTMRDPTEYWRGASATGPVLAAFLEAEMLRHSLPHDRLASSLRRPQSSATPGCSQALSIFRPRRASLPFCSCTAKRTRSFP